MLRSIFLSVVFIFLALGVQAQEINRSPFGEYATYQLDTSFSLQSVWGTHPLRDIVETTGSASVSLVGGDIRVSTGTTAGSDGYLRTVRRGLYAPGRHSEVGIRVNLTSPPTGDGVAKWGLFDGDNGIFYRYYDSNADGTLEICLVYQKGSQERERCWEDFVRPAIEGLDVTSESIVWIIHFVWYGGGGADFYAMVPDDDSTMGLKKVFLGNITPEQGKSVEDPNLPIAVRANNGTTTTDIQLDVGGRRYDVAGDFKPPVKTTFDRRLAVDVGTTYTPLICVRRDPDFPTPERQNSVQAYLESLTPTVSSEDITVAYVTVDPADLTGASFSAPEGFDDSITALDYDTSATGITNYTILDGGFVYPAGSAEGPGDADQITRGRDQQIPVIADEALCAIARADSGTANVDATLRVTSVK